jgi:VIT1/CCC1 family predicted Fe2+/Mn2+ transporter
MALNLFCFQSNVMADELLGYTATKARKTAHRTLEVRVKNAVDGVDMTSFSTQANNDSNRTGVGKSGELMKTGNVLRRVYGVTAALIGVLFFFIIVGVFGLPLAIAGLAVFVLGAVVVCRLFPTEGARL